MVKYEQLLGRQREFCISLPLVVGEFHLVGAVEELHYSADLSSQKPFRRN